MGGTAAGWEREAVAQARQGVPGAYARLVGRYQAPVRHAVLRIVRDQDHCRDVVQQAFVTAWEHLDDYDPDHRFFSWIYRIAVNGALNAVRDGRRVRPLEGVDPPTAEPGADLRLELRERDAALHRALGALPPGLRVLLALRYELDLGCGTIGRILELPASTVKSRLHAARGRLRCELAGSAAAAGRRTRGRPPVRDRRASCG